MSTLELIGFILIGFGLIYIILRGIGKISDEIATFETQIFKVKGGTGLILIAFGIFIFVVGTFFAGWPFLSPPTPTPSIMPTPTPATTTPPTPTPYIIDTMDSMWSWKTYREDNKSSINITSIRGRTGNAIEISYDLKENGGVSIYREINPEILFEKEGILFFYKASGGPTTLIIGLEYEDTTQFVSSGRATATDNWVPVKVPFLLFTGWDGDSELDDLQKVRKIVFIIENRPEQGDVYGSGWVIIDDVQTITS